MLPSYILTIDSVATTIQSRCTEEHLFSAPQLVLWSFILPCFKQRCQNLTYHKHSTKVLTCNGSEQLG